MKRFLSVLAICFVSISVFALELVDSASPKKNTYVMYITPYDFGGVADKLVINTGKDIKDEDIKAADFEVDMVLSDSSRSDSGMGFSKGERKVVKAFLSDESGLPSIESHGKYITLKLEVKPEQTSSSSLVDTYILQLDSFYGAKIENSKLDISINRQTAVVCPEAAKFKTSKYKWVDPDEDSTDTITMNYASYVPENSETKKIPLIVFFHGIGESGDDIYKPLLGIKGVALAGKKIQSHFKDGAAVLLPQCPTGWLEITEKDPFGNRLWAVVDLKGTVHDKVSKVTDPVNNFFSRVFATPIYDSYTSTVKTPNSYYSKAAKELIDKFVKENPQIDTSRIYVGGCSAGGFMTVNMLIQYTDFFAAAFPICEAFPNDRINDNDIERISKKPMWFTLAKNDTTIKPEKNTIPTVKRLEEADAKNLHHVYFDDVHDTSGQFFMGSEVEDDDEKNPDSTKKLPYQYSGHESWIYVLNDEVSDDGLNLFDWLAGQRNGN